MSVLGHVAVGVVVARATTRPATEPSGASLATRMTAFTALALLPDVDFLLRPLAAAVPAFDHRGATHSLVIAAVVGLIVAWVLLVSRSERPLRWGALAAAVVASHGLLDVMGDSQLGVQLLWPFSDVRFMPWQLLPDPALVPPLARNFFGALGAEAVLFLPAWLYAFVPRSLLPGALRRVTPR